MRFLSLLLMLGVSDPHAGKVSNRPLRAEDASSRLITGREIFWLIVVVRDAKQLRAD